MSTNKIQRTDASTAVLAKDLLVEKILRHANPLFFTITEQKKACLFLTKYCCIFYNIRQ